MNNIAIFNVSVSPWIAIPVVYFLWVTILLFLKKIALGVIKKLAATTKTKLDDIPMTIKMRNPNAHQFFFWPGTAFRRYSLDMKRCENVRLLNVMVGMKAKNGFKPKHLNNQIV